MKKNERSRRRLYAAVWLIGAMLIVSACGAGIEEKAGVDAKGKLTIMTTIAQIADPIAVIGGERVEVNSLMGPGVDPHLFTATQGDIQKLQEADMIFYNGLGLEINMVQVFEQIGKDRPVLAVGDGIAEDALLHDEEGAIDPHIWFEIDLWQQALTAATEQMKEASPDDAAYFDANKEQYFAEMNRLKDEAEAKMAHIPEGKRVLVTAHDAFGYFGRMLDLDVIGLQGLSTDAEIGLTDIEETIAILTEHQVPAVFVESSINPESINAVIEGAAAAGLDVQLGGELFSDAMGAAGTEEGTYLGMYAHNVNTIAQALGDGEE